MKRLMTLVTVALFSFAAFAQDNKMQPTAVNAPMKIKHECFMMKDGKLLHCLGDKAVDQTSEVKLRSGGTLMPDGTIKNAEGKSVKMQDGQCVTYSGLIEKCEDMHAKDADKSKDQMAVPEKEATPNK